jgi:excinuclease UvrABC helicase subunit UvrB
MSNENFNDVLINLLIKFKNRPYHLAKFLLDNSAFNKTFLNKLVKNDRLKSEEKDNYICDISQLEDYYNSLLEIKNSKSIEDLTKELNDKLDEMIQNEKFEEAAKIRDLMIKKSIKRLKK